MAKIPYFDTYRVPKGIQGRPATRLVSFRTIAGTITRVDVWNPFPTSGTLRFNLLKNGVAIWSGLDRPSMDAGETHVAKTGLAISVAQGDELSWNLEVNDGNLSDSVLPSFAVIVDDGEDEGGGGSGGGGGWGPPAIPDAYDDEFEGPTLGPDWTLATSGTAPATSFRSSYLVADFSAANGEVSLTKPFVPGSADFSIAAKYSVRSQDDYQGAQLFAYDAAESDGVRLATYRGNVYAHEYPAFSPVTNETDILGGGGGTGIDSDIVLLLQRVGGIYTFGYSKNGISFRRMTTTSAKSFTVAKVKLILMQSGASTKMREAIDWIRFNDIFV